jgi:hypothetical protein
MAAWYSGQAVKPAASCSRMTRLVSDCFSGFRRLFGEQFLAVGDPADHAGRAAAQGQADQVRAAVQDVLHGQHAAPGTAEQVQAVEVEGVADLGQFLDEPVHGPE